jgi:hypothetical protein
VPYDKVSGEWIESEEDPPTAQEALGVATTGDEGEPEEEPEEEPALDPVLGPVAVGWLMIAGAGLIVISCFLPWVQLGSVLAVSRTILQYGKGLAIDTDGWGALLIAVLIAGFGLRRVLFESSQPKLRDGIILLVAAGWYLGQSWLGVKFQGVAITRGVGGAVALLGVALAGGALIAGSRDKAD